MQELLRQDWIKGSNYWWTVNVFDEGWMHQIVILLVSTVQVLVLYRSCTWIRQGLYMMIVALSAPQLSQKHCTVKFVEDRRSRNHEPIQWVKSVKKVRGLLKRNCKQIKLEWHSIVNDTLIYDTLIDDTFSIRLNFNKLMRSLQNMQGVHNMGLSDGQECWQGRKVSLYLDSALNFFWPKSFCVCSARSAPLIFLGPNQTFLICSVKELKLMVI